MARALIVGCGCRGTSLARRLVRSGWQVRGTSRSEAGIARIEAEGIEGVIADPDRVGTVLDCVADVAVVVWALGSADGPSALDVNGPRLERTLEGLVDTPVRGFVYEAAGSVDPEALAAGTELVRAAAVTWRIPVEIVTEPPERADEWTDAMEGAVARCVEA